MRQGYQPGKRIAVFAVDDGYPVGAAKLGELVDVREDGQWIVQFDHESGWAVINESESHVVAMPGSTTDPYAVVGTIVSESDGEILVRYDSLPLVARGSDDTVEMVARSDGAFERHVARKSMLSAVQKIVDPDTADLLRRTLPRVAAEVDEDEQLESALHGVGGEGLA